MGSMLGSPVPRQQAFHFRFELAGDSFQEQLQNSGDAEATSGRGLVSVVFGLTNWSEIYVRAGLAEFNVDEALFRGDYGFAYGGGVRLRLLPLPFGSIGLAASICASPATTMTVWATWSRANGKKLISLWGS